MCAVAWMLLNASTTACPVAQLDTCTAAVVTEFAIFRPSEFTGAAQRAVGSAATTAVSLVPRVESLCLAA